MPSFFYSYEIPYRGFVKKTPRLISGSAEPLLGTSHLTLPTNPSTSSLCPIPPLNSIRAVLITSCSADEAAITELDGSGESIGRAITGALVIMENVGRMPSSAELDQATRKILCEGRTNFDSLCGRIL